jgi:NAD-dependent deacetylase
MTDERTPADAERDTTEAIAAALTAADHAVALTGAGVSTASGIPDFRSEDGIWSDYDPADFEYGRFRADPAAFWRRWVGLRASVYAADADPNAAHEALADMEQAGVLDSVLTQNIDGLHEEAGSASVVRLHGNGQNAVCVDCGVRVDADPVHERVADGETPPRCDACGGTLKPDVVLFGQQLPEGALRSARDHARRADVFLAVGSSLTVEPAASLPRIVARRGGLHAPVAGSKRMTARSPGGRARSRGLFHPVPVVPYRGFRSAGQTALSEFDAARNEAVLPEEVAPRVVDQ